MRSGRTGRVPAASLPVRPAFFTGPAPRSLKMDVGDGCALASASQRSVMGRMARADAGFLSGNPAGTPAAAVRAALQRRVAVYAADVREDGCPAALRKAWTDGGARRDAACGVIRAGRSLGAVLARTFAPGSVVGGGGRRPVDGARVVLVFSATEDQDPEGGCRTARARSAAGGDPRDGVSLHGAAVPGLPSL